MTVIAQKINYQQQHASCNVITVRELD